MASYEVSYSHIQGGALVREVYATWKEAKARIIELCKTGAYAPAVRTARRKGKESEVS
jgi:hypothetical protein